MASSQTISNQSANHRKVLELAHRLFLSLIGSYCFSWGFTALGLAALVALGVSFHEAETTLMLLGFFVLVPLFLWAFVAQNLVKVWVILGGGATLMTAAAWAIQTILLS